MGTSVKNSKYLTLGSGLLQFQEYTEVEADQFMKLIDFGAQKDTKVKTTRTKVQYKEGQPSSVVVEDISEEAVSIETTFSELTIDEILVRLGTGSKSSVVANASKSVKEYKTLTGTVYEALEGCGTLASVVVKTIEATPQTCVLNTDYVIGTKFGRAAIKRVSTSSLIADGDQVEVSYDYSARAYDQLDFGGDSNLKYYHMRHIKPLRDGSSLITDFYKVGSSGSDEANFMANDYGGVSASFTVMRDESKAEGQQFYSRRYEKLA